MTTTTEASTDGLDALYDAALPADAPGAWIRQAIERMRAGVGEDQ